jgi:hypothetical protein
VFVLRDEFDGAVGAWGTVARKLWGRPGAWVRLDERHERCSYPFPTTDESRATWILTSPERCSSFAPSEPEVPR